MPAIAAAIYSNGYHPFFIGFLSCIGAAALLQSLPPPMKGEPQLTPAQRLLYGTDKKLTPAQRWQKALKKVKAATIFQNLLAEIPTAEDSHAENRKKYRKSNKSRNCRKSRNAKEFRKPKRSRKYRKYRTFRKSKHEGGVGCCVFQGPEKLTHREMSIPPSPP